MAELYYIGIEDKRPQTSTKGLSKARVMAVKLLKETPNGKSKKAIIENAKSGTIEGKVILNYKGVGVWIVGRTAWMISKNGDIYDKQPYW